VKVTLQDLPCMSTCSADSATGTWTSAVAFAAAAYHTGQPDSTGPAVLAVQPSYDVVVAAAVVVDAVCKTHIQKQVGVLVYSYRDR